MQMTSERRLPVSRDRVWEALNDPETLAACIPGCESMERSGDDEFQATVIAKVGPVEARFKGKVTVADRDPPKSYRLIFEGSGGAAGFAKGEASVRLDEEDSRSASRIGYAVQANVGGKLAQMGGRLVDGAARKLADQFFDNLTERLAAPSVAQSQLQEPVGRSWTQILWVLLALAAVLLVLGLLAVNR